MAMGSEPKLQEAAKVSFAEVESGINSLATETKTIKAMALIVLAELKGKDKRFEGVIVPFMEEAERTLKHLDELLKETGGLFLNVCLYFGWPEAKAKSITNDKFFGEMHQFMEAFTSLWKVEEAVEERKNFEKMVKKKERLDSITGGKTGKDAKKENGKQPPAKDTKGAPEEAGKTAAADSAALPSQKKTLIKKFRNSAQLAPLAVGGSPPPDDGLEAPTPAKTLAPPQSHSPSPTPPKEIAPSTPSSSAANLKKKFGHKS